MTRSAEVIKSFLSSQGIVCQIPDEHMAGMVHHMTPALGNVRIQVESEQFEEAKKLLEQFERIRTAGPGG